MSDELDVRASDAERERVAASLREHCAAGRLTLEELSTRLDEAYRARTSGELEAALRELPAQPETRPRRSPKRFSIAIFSGVERKGRWRVPLRSFAFCLFGGAELDLRHAEIDGDEVTLYVVDVFGGTDVYVPEGVDLDVGGFALFGGVDEHGRDAPAPVGAPLVRVRVLALFGAADVWRVPPGSEGPLRQVRRLARGSS